MPSATGVVHDAGVPLAPSISTRHSRHEPKASRLSVAQSLGILVPSAAAATAIMSVMSLGCALVGNFPLLFVCRLVQGIGVGGEMPVAAAYISELSRSKGRGRFFMLYEMIFPVGLMATGQIGTVLVPLLGWKILFLLGGIPGLILTVLLLRLPESPRWLVAQGRLDDAEAIIRDVEASARRHAHKVRLVLVQPRCVQVALLRPLGRRQVEWLVGAPPHGRPRLG